MVERLKQDQKKLTVEMAGLEQLNQTIEGYGAVSEQGNLLVFDVATLAKELRRVRNTSLSYPVFVQPGSQGNPPPF